MFVISGPVTSQPTIYTIPINDDVFIDPEQSGNFAQYLCHSCDPNCGIQNRTHVVAMRDILPGEEITIDYAMIVPRYGSEMSAENRICHCGSPLCRGKLGSYEELDGTLRQKYAGFISGFLLKHPEV